ncbi:hypothetical protein AQI88_25115 [Streptomyces cellostaticus]|uniref:Secreted protein n=1 Tax=Streptomyces cellostaticus TaxID=67285 RepID=A0A117PV59_9ACTN|nr:hypothetical protein [Streptomyces cellostaticus]KUM93695.1 hypothetical protein AQI88_25115 [Streptomyces cellostaticus]GHI07596.1 hypothetical protein Scel_59170 [Streptomyces cellostaticus]
MGGLSVRRIASTALCAGLLAGVTGPAAVAADSAPERVRAAAHTPVPGADALLSQVTNLGNLQTVLGPVLDLLHTVLKADNGQLSADQATKLVQAAKDAIAKAKAAAPTTTDTTKEQADLVNDALASLDKALDTLQKGVTSGDPGQAGSAVTGVLAGLVNLLTGLLHSAG